MDDYNIHIRGDKMDIYYRNTKDKEVLGVFESLGKLNFEGEIFRSTVGNVLSKNRKPHE